MTDKNVTNKLKNKITEATRQGIIDLINMGIQNSDTSEDTKIYWSGRLMDHDFLSRLYNLSNMDSRDSRYKNAYGDIYQHTVLNSDWDDDWVFFDSRFNLKYGDDENFLKFLCEMFHPAVRDEKKNWRWPLKFINKLLCIDGYELYEKSYLANKAIYGWRSIINQNAVIQSQAENLMQNFDSDYIRLQINAMNIAIDNNPYDAIGKAKELLETCCKTILKHKNIPINTRWDIIKLTKETNNVLKLTPDNIDNAAKASDTIKNLLSTLSTISQSMAELRNSYGSGHGKDANFKGLSPRHARLAVGASVTAVHFLWETFEARNTETDT